VVAISAGYDFGLALVLPDGLRITPQSGFASSGRLEGLSASHRRLIP